MTPWLVGATLRRAPRRAALEALGVAFPVAMLAATLLFIDRAVGSMTRVALEPVQVEQRALAASLDVDMTKLSRELAVGPGVTHVDRYAGADVVVRTRSGGGATARLFAVDRRYLRDHPWVCVVRGSFGRGALLDQTLRDFLPGFAKARTVTVEIPGGGGSLSLPVAGTVDLRNALATWFAIPTGEVQGDIALVPRAIVIPFSTFQRTLLPALRAKLGPTTPVLNPGLTDLPPLSLEAHVSVDHGAYPSDPGNATVWSDALRHLLEARRRPGRSLSPTTPRSRSSRPTRTPPTPRSSSSCSGFQARWPRRRSAWRRRRRLRRRSVARTDCCGFGARPRGSSSVSPRHTQPWPAFSARPSVCSRRLLP